jgi:hypothetical protein
VLLLGAHAVRVTGQDTRPEAGLVLPAVAALPCAAALLLCLAAVAVALAVLGVLGAPGYGADPPPLGLGHAASATVSALGGGDVKKMDVPLGIVVVGVVLLIGCRLIVWWPGVILGAALILGVLVPSAAGRRARRLADAEVSGQTDDQL